MLRKIPRIVWLGALLTVVLAVFLFTDHTVPGDPTLAKFSALTPGMSYSQANSLVGVAGTLVSSTNIPNAGSAEVYAWDASDGGRMTAMFEDGKMISKAQVGLK